MKIRNPFSTQYESIEIPDNSTIIKMTARPALKDPDSEIRRSLENPIDSLPLSVIAESCIRSIEKPKAVIVVSDNTRPMPYKGKGNVLLPVIDTLINAGFSYDCITILVATGMHKAMGDSELKAMLDPFIFEKNIKVVNHDATDKENLTDLGYTSKGGHVTIDSTYMKADLKIVTGLIESHFMAGASGGRKAICPGLIGEESTFVFHGPELMANPKSTNLVIEGNPVHEESLEFATKAGIDFLLNVTLNNDFEITGVFAGNYKTAHFAGIDFIKEEVAVNTEPADIVITHGGFVGINHYQCGKCAVASLGALKEGGYLVILADTKDPKDCVGSLNYKTCLNLLTTIGADNYYKLICSKDWTFIPDQWQVQQWGKLFQKTDMDKLYFFSPQLDKTVFDGLPGNILDSKTGYANAVKESLSEICKRENKKIEDFSITYISDGPYVVPFSK